MSHVKLTYRSPLVKVEADAYLNRVEPPPFPKPGAFCPQAIQTHLTFTVVGFTPAEVRNIIDAWGRDPVALRLTVERVDE